MEKAAVSVTFQVPEDGKPAGAAGERSSGVPLPMSPRPTPALRARAFTTGSLWEILSHARSAPAHVTTSNPWHTGGSISGGRTSDGQRPATHSRLITDYVHMERRHRRRHWSEFDAASGGASPRGSGFSPSPSASIADLKSTSSSDMLLKPGGIRQSLPRSSREVQMRLDPRLGGSSSGRRGIQNQNRNSLLASAYISSSLTCLSSLGKRRSHSAPAADTEPDLPELDGVDGNMPYWRTPQLFSGGGGMSFLADSMRSISIYRKSSVNSTGSADDEPGGGSGREGCLTPSGTFNVSSGSSVSVPSYRLAVLCVDDSFRARLVEHFVGLGDVDDDDDVFADEDGPEKSAFLTLEGEEYYLTFSNASTQDVSTLHDVDAWVVVHNTETPLERTAAIFDNMMGRDVTCGVLLLTGDYTSDAQKTEAERLTTERNIKLLELPSLTPASSLMTLSRLVLHLQGSERPGTTTPQLPVMRSRRMPGLSFHDVTVDKQTLFNRFFRRTLSTKSCDNLLAL